MENNLLKVAIGVDATLLCSAVAMPSHLCLIQKAYLRGAQLLGVSHLITVTNRDFSSKPKMSFAESMLNKTPFLRANGYNVNVSME